jgi:hypothetical protein
MEPLRVYRPVVADSRHFEEKLDLFRIRIKVKRWIWIRMKVRIRNPDPSPPPTTTLVPFSNASSEN